MMRKINKNIRVISLEFTNGCEEKMSIFAAVMARKPIIIRSRLAPKSYCINLFGTFWARDTSWIDGKVINHERIHTAQMRELLFIPFYVLYVLEWLVLLVKLRDSRKAYRAISFEREAYDHAGDSDYLGRRHHYSQWRKICSKQN